jgi:hypothetical protein
MTDPVPLSRRVAMTKRQTDELAPAQTGRPAAKVFGMESATCPGLLDAVIYDMPDGRRVIACPENHPPAVLFLVRRLSIHALTSSFAACLTSQIDLAKSQ